MNFAIIPAYNEEKTIAQVVEKAKQYLPIIVVDDGSTDATAEKAAHAGATVLKHRVNVGKGAALKTGCEHALAQGAEKIVLLDADGQHNPEHIPVFLNALEKYDIAFGARRIPENMPLIMRFGNKVINTTFLLLYNIRIEDSQSGYRAFRASAYPFLRWEALDYAVETEMIIKAGKRKLSHCTIPIETIYGDKYKGTTVLDGMLIVARMFGWRLWR